MMHRHQWEKVGEKYNMPPLRQWEAENVPSKVWERLVHGFTVITYRCKKCPEQRYDQVIGRTEDAI